MNTMNYTAALEALDAKAGRVHTREDSQRVYQKSLSAPETVTDDDLVIAGYFGGEKSVAEYRARREKALAPPAPPPLPPAARPRATPLVTHRDLRKSFDAYSTSLVKVIKEVKKQIEDVKGRINVIAGERAALHDEVFKSTLLRNNALLAGTAKDDLGSGKSTAAGDTASLEAMTRRLTALELTLSREVCGRLSTVETGLSEVKAQPRPRYLGVHRDDAEYTVGDMVTRSGGLWYCEHPTTRATPGTAASGWLLVVKAGRAA